MAGAAVIVMAGAAMDIAGAAMVIVAIGAAA